MKDTVHLGENIRRICELKGIKQEALAEKMEVSQAAISKLFATPNIDDEKLEFIAGKIGVSVNAIKNFDADALMLFIENVNAHDHSTGCVARIEIYNNHPVEDIKELYERLLKNKDEEIARLKQELAQK